MISEISVTPDMVNFGEMKKDEKKSEKFVLRNTSKITLEVLPIKSPADNITIEPITEIAKWPVVLKPDDSLEFTVGYTYNTEIARISQPVKIKYTGGEATDVSLRVVARLHPDFIKKMGGVRPAPSQTPKVIHSLSGKVPPTDQQPEKPLNIIAPTPLTNEQDDGNTP